MKSDVAELRCDFNDLEFTNISILLRNVDILECPGSEFIAMSKIHPTTTTCDVALVNGGEESNASRMR